MKQLEQLLRQFIPKFDYFKVFSSQMHIKNLYEETIEFENSVQD